MPNILLYHIDEVISESIKGIDDEGEGLDPFSDCTDAEYYGSVTKIEAYCGEIVDRVRFTYEDGREGSIHGGSGGFNYAFDLEAGEYLTKNRLGYYIP